MQSIDISQLQEWLAAKRDFMLLDVREVFEHELFNIGGVNIPLGTLTAQLVQVPPDSDVVVYCAKGIRSVIAIQKLEAKGYTRLYNLSGGIQYLQA